MPSRYDDFMNSLYSLFNQSSGTTANNSLWPIDLFGLESAWDMYARYGTSGDDKMTGSSQDETFYGGAGEDTIRGGSGDDEIHGEDGADRLEGQNGDDQMDGGAGNDYLNGGNGDDIVYGGDGNDDVRGGAGNDEVHGGDNNDTVRGNDGDDQLFGDGGDDKLYGGDGDDELNGGEGSDLLKGQDGDDELYGDAGNDKLYGGTGDDVLNGGDGDDRLYGEAGDDMLYGDDGDDVLKGQNGEDTLYGGAGDDLLHGGADADALFGGDGDDSLYGADGDDILNGGTGINYLSGGNGNDTAAYFAQSADFDVFRLEDGKIVVISKDQQTIDTLYKVEYIQFADKILATDDPSIPLFGSSADIHVEGTDLDDVLEGGDGNDTISGADGDDVLIGGSGRGNDTLIGGSGKDWVVYTSADESIRVDLAEGVASGDPDIGVDTLIGIENVVAGRGDDMIIGDAGDNVLVGHDGDDVISGGGGEDVLLGGAGYDVVTIDGNIGDYQKQAETEIIRVPGHRGEQPTFQAVEVSFSNGTDTIKVGGVEEVRFADRTVFLDGRNNGPDAANDSYSVAGNTFGVAAAGGLLANDGDFDGDQLQVVAFTGETAEGGQITVNADGSFSYVPPAGFNGADSFTYEISDGRGGSSTATVELNVTAVNQAPEAAADAVAAKAGQPVTFDVLANDSDADGDVLTVSGIASQPSHGVVTVNGNGTITYVPADGYTGEDSFSYRVSDGNGGSSVATVRIDVAAVNVGPTASDDVATTDQGSSIVIDVLANDSDGDGDALSIQAITEQPAHGSVFINNDGTITYTPAEGFHGEDSFKYRVGDGNGGFSIATASVLVNKINAVPEATDDFIGVDAGQSIVIDVLANDVDADGDALAIDGIVQQPAHGLVTVNADGTLTYVPADGFSGEDTFVYRATDAQGATATATVIITVDPVSGNLDWGVTPTILGTDANDRIYGVDGVNDVISGGAGADWMDGGSGDDSYLVDNVNDVIGERYARGFDTAVSSVDYSIEYNYEIESIRLVGSANINATGNANRNLLIGNDGDNRLDGLSYWDTLRGGKGNDTYYAHYGDSVEEKANEGIDTVYLDTYKTGKLWDNVENLILTGSEAWPVHGNDLDNRIVGNLGANKMYGYAGNDTLEGGAGNDTLDGGDGLDVAVYSGNASDYTVSKNAYGDYVVKSNGTGEGTDTLSNIEVLRFADGDKTIGEWNGGQTPTDPTPTDPTPTDPTPTDPTPTDPTPTDPTPTDPTPTDPTPTDPTPTDPTPTDPTPTDPVPADPIPVDSSGSISTPGLTGANVLKAPHITQAAEAEDVVAVRLYNYGSSAEDSGYKTFGQVFAKGDVPSGTGLTAMIDGVEVPLQMDVKATHDDGSVRHAVLTVASPALDAGEAIDVMLKTSSDPAPTGSVSIASILDGGYDVDVDMKFGSKSYHIEAADVLADALQSGDYTTWLNGPLTSEYSVQVDVTDMIQVRFDIRANADGTVTTDVVFSNSHTFSIDTQNVTYDVSIKQNGQVVESHNNLQHHQNGTWHAQVESDGGNSVQVIYDVDYLIETGAIPAIDTSMGAREGEVVSAYDGLVNDNDPMSNAGVRESMPAPGGRDDIGLMPAWTVDYLLSQDARAEAVMLRNADASGSVPWHYIDEATGDVVSVEDHPRLYLGSANVGNATTPVGGASAAGTGWEPDSAHQPALNYVPYLITGSQYYRDELKAQVSWTIGAVDPNYREDGEGLMERGNQVRGQAWTMRNLGDAAYILPDDDQMKGYFESILDKNLEAYVQKYVIDGAYDSAGELEGFIWRDRYVAPGAVAPWEDDFFTMAMGTLASRGYDLAQTMLEWKANWTVGRFLAEEQGFNPYVATSYRIFVRDEQTGTHFSSWDQLYTDSNDGSTSLVGTPNAADGYPAIAAGALATMIDAGVDGAVEAFGFVVGETVSMHANYEKNGVFHLAPLIGSDGDRLGEEDYIIGNDSANTLTGTNANEFLHGLKGNDVISGGGGADWVFGGDGNDKLYGNAGDDQLFGGKGNDQLTGGSGNDLLNGGAGADQFIFDSNGTGKDVIEDFETGLDDIVLKANMNGNGIDSGADALAAISANSDGDAVIDLGNGNHITLLGVDPDDLSASDFIFN
ncbi:Ig-like domain-containing protein [Oceanibacterium hippocampi]|uniref:Bifunctional hemolysin/adenylate cyclase n=1 Tax=Oceanibacterium hippocampi TaxID=745714 RepID=A0A1Y5TPQ8_9PROT|nr:Ig-like domain-containing protein [Oceanibacterium hippocampi]SLN69235.1 Bifunctional hemolysin/adenylate cyclase precursor [Oceanibacterium hippocampi]